MRILIKFVLPVVIVAVAFALMLAMVRTKPEPETRIPDVPLPIVRVHQVEVDTLQMTVTSQGTVSPRTETVLVPEVAGTIVSVAASFENGGFFEDGDVLLRVDPYDYRQTLIEARARVTQAELRLAQEEAEAGVAREEWKALGEGDASPLTLREPQVADARAAVEAARANADRAQRDLERTEIRAPFAGRVRGKMVDLGRYVSRGTPLATIYAVDFAEVRLPLPDADLQFVELPLAYRGEGPATRGPEVALFADFAGERHRWTGRIVRTEGEIDAGTRMLHSVARVRDPYGRGGDPSRPPLAAGMFVEAEIMGRTFDAVVTVPRAALRDGNRVLVVGDDDRLRFREVQVLRLTRSEAIVSAGLHSGERVCISALAAVTDGMQVRVVDAGGA